MKLPKRTAPEPKISIRSPLIIPTAQAADGNVGFLGDTAIRVLMEQEWHELYPTVSAMLADIEGCPALMRLDEKIPFSGRLQSWLDQWNKSGRPIIEWHGLDEKDLVDRRNREIRHRKQHP